MDIAKYARGIVLRHSEGVLLERLAISMEGWVPTAGNCHGNVDRFVLANPTYRYVRGYLVFDTGSGNWRIVAHSVLMDPNGTMFDVTPPWRCERYPFVRHVGHDDDFLIMAKEECVDLYAVDIPSIHPTK